MRSATLKTLVSCYRRVGPLLLGWLALSVFVSASSCSDSPGGDQDRPESAAGADSSEIASSQDIAEPPEAVGTGADPVATAATSPNDLLTSLDEQTIELQFALGEWHGDLDGIISERARLVRFLTVFEPMFYLIDGRKQAGMAFEAAREFESFLNKRLGRTRAADRIRVIIVPVRRDELIPFIRDGRGDIAAANLTITDDRLSDVAFSDPVVANAFEVVVTGPSADPETSLD